MKSIQSVLLLGLSLVFLTNCSSLNRSHVGAVSGGATGVTACITAGASDPYVTGACAIVVASSLCLLSAVCCVCVSV